MIFSLSDEEFDNLDWLSDHYKISMSGILRIGLSSLIHRHNAHGKLWKDDEITYRKRKSSL